MMQSLLSDRFKLAAHFETKQVPVYALVVADTGKPGPQLKQDDGAEPCPATLTTAEVQRLMSPVLPGPSSSGSQPLVCGALPMMPPAQSGHVRVAGKKVTMGLLAGSMGGPASGIMDRPIIDRTGLAGTFDVNIEWAPPISGPGLTPDPNGPTFNQALEDQLGLRLEPTTAPVRSLVIDRIERLSSN